MADLRDTVLAYLAALDAHRVIGSVSSSLAMSDAEQALRAAVATPPDTGWRPRPPTVEEVRAHHEAHGGYWMGQVIQSATTPFVVWIAETKGLGGLGVYCDRCPWNDPSDVEWKNAFTADWYGGCMWRPLDHAGDPAPWPEVGT